MFECVVRDIPRAEHDLATVNSAERNKATGRCTCFAGRRARRYSWYVHAVMAQSQKACFLGSRSPEFELPHECVSSLVVECLANATRRSVSLQWLAPNAVDSPPFDAVMCLRLMIASTTIQQSPRQPSLVIRSRNQ